MLIPLNGLLKQSSEGSSLAYLRDALACVFGDAEACGPEAVHGEWAGRCLLIYVAFNLAWKLLFISFPSSNSLEDVLNMFIKQVSTGS